jgi:type IV secretory pathway VirB10-like protein
MGMTKGTEMDKKTGTDTTPAAPPATPPAPPAAPPATNDEAAALRIQQERDQYKKALEALQEQLKDAAKESDVAAAVKAVEEKSQASLAALVEKQANDRKVFAVDLALTKAGCVDLVAAKAHVDLAKVELDEGGAVTAGFDAAKFATEKAYLFPKPQTESSGGAGSHSAGKDEAKTILDGAIAHLSDKKG